MICTSWLGGNLKEIERVEGILKREGFTSPEPTTSTQSGFMGWSIQATPYSSGNQLVTLHRYRRAFRGHPFGSYLFGAITFRRVEKETYEKLLPSYGGEE